jgi:hypothetical protein
VVVVKSQAYLLEIIRALHSPSCLAGSLPPTRIPIIAITTKSSTNVNALRYRRFIPILHGAKK